MQPAHSAARSAVKPALSGSRSRRRSNRRAAAAHGSAQDGSAAGRLRRERREQLLDLAGGALRARDERAVARDELLETVVARTARVFVDRHSRIVSRAAAAVCSPRRVQSGADSIHRRGTRTHMPIRSPSRTRAAVARTLPELEAALAGRDDVALVPTMGALHDGHRALLRAARRVRRDGRDVAVRESRAVRAGRGLRALPARRGGRPRDRRRGGRRRRVRPRRRRRSIPPGFATTVDPGPARRRARGPLAPRPLPRRRHRRDAPLRPGAAAARRSSARRTSSSS